MYLKSFAFLILGMCVAGRVVAQLPAEAVMLGKLKISEQQKSETLDPVTLKEANPALPTWTHDGVTYGASDAGSQAEFEQNPSKYVEAAAKKRWENNFIVAMSTIWCPVTDEVTSGGNTKWEKLGIQWESCCQFCNETVVDEDFPRGLEILKERAGDSYKLLGGAKYVEGASSPVEGAIDFTGGLGTPAAHHKEMDQVPAWLNGVELEATYSGGIGLIMENRCVSCHRLGGSAPMPMTTYREARAWTTNMKANIETNLMPPWPATRTTEYANATFLTKKEKEVFLEWIAAGYPRGEGEYTPANTAGKWSIGEPDHVFSLPEYIIPENVAEEVREFMFATDFDEDKWIVAAQVKPTDPYILLELDAGPLGAWHATNDTVVPSNGAAYLLTKGEAITVRVFYISEEGWEEYDDSTQIAVKFGDAPPVGGSGLLRDRMANEAFTIPAGAKKSEASATFVFPADGQIVGANPVLRQRGKSVRMTATPPGGMEQEFLSIPFWNPTLHLRYQLAKPIPAPKGTTVTITATYDNSEGNVLNPDAKAVVNAGPGGEVLEGWLEYTLD